MTDTEQSPPQPRRPVLKRPPVLFDKTQSLLARIEDRLGAPVLVYWNSGGGSVCDNDVLGLYELLHHAKRLDKVYIFIKSDGGTLNSDYPAHSYPITAREARRIGLNVESLFPEVNDELLALNRLYSEMGQSAVTDFDENNQHNNRILNILERHGLQVFYQVDKDWRYRPEERRWVSLNDESSWHKVQPGEQGPVVSKIHIS
jgi:hypothetical protein